MSGSEEYQHLPHLRNSIFDQDREGPVIYARATNINRTHAAYVNIFNFESLSRTRHFGLFAQSILARRTKKVQFRLVRTPPLLVQHALSKHSLMLHDCS